MFASHMKQWRFARGIQGGMLQLRRPGCSPSGPGWHRRLSGSAASRSAACAAPRSASCPGPMPSSARRTTAAQHRVISGNMFAVGDQSNAGCTEHMLSELISCRPAGTLQH